MVKWKPTQPRDRDVQMISTMRIPPQFRFAVLAQA
jgi:hypothetical protein